MVDFCAVNDGFQILYASVSAKWAVRSERNQNSRTKAFGIKNRKGHLPHIVVVIGETLPSRLAYLTLETEDIDCMNLLSLIRKLE